jgi:hypothetical protein
MKMRVPVVRVRMEATAAFLETTTRALAKLALLARTVKNVSVAAVLVASLCLVLLLFDHTQHQFSEVCLYIMFAIVRLQFVMYCA